MSRNRRHSGEVGALRSGLALGLVFGLFAIAGCTGEPRTVPLPATPEGAGTGAPSAGALRPVGNPTVIVSGLEAPWSVVRLESGSALISERDTGAIDELGSDGTIREIGRIAGVVHEGEGGLLGLETLADGDRLWLYAYLTTASDNRILRMPLLGSAGDYTLGTRQEILTGLAKAGNHDGGRIKFGPDGMLYATVGDAGQGDRAQDPASLNGKILRMTPTGDAPSDNPTEGSLVYSMGHRNPQGIAWDANGQLFAAEFGQNTWDELNRIEPGGNYGWPIVEGIAEQTGFIDPIYQWATADASPSGLAYLDGTFFMAALRGERLWTVYPGDPTIATDWFANGLGRIRDAVAGPDGTLWILTNNTDGRGSPRENDDKLLQVRLEKSSG
jgi:glucose/arabinose dehydrogenase